MPLTYSVFRHLIYRCTTIDVRHLLTTVCLFILLSFLTSIIINLLFPTLWIQHTSSSAISSSLSVLPSSHIFFPAGVTSLQCSPQENRQLQTHHYESINTKRTYTKTPSQSTNISRDLRQEAAAAVPLAVRLIAESKFDKARKVFEHALILDPYNADLLLEYGQFLENHHQDFIRAEHLYTRALVKQPSHFRALQLKQRTLPLVEEIDQKYFTRIDNLLQEFYRIPDTNPYLRRAKRDAYYLHIYHSNAIEGNTLTLYETQYIIETRMAIGGKSLIEQQEVIGLDFAWQYLNCTLVNRLGSITREDIMEIHRRVLGFVDPIEAGRLRQHQVYVGSFIPPSASEISAYLDDFLLWLNSLDETRDLHAIELAAIAHYKFVYIHPFIDGNGRTGRLLMNLILMRSGFPPVIIRISERMTYYAHLDQANDGDVRPFIRFIAKCTERTLTEFLDQSQLINTRQELRLTDYDEDLERNIIQERVIMVE